MPHGVLFRGGTEEKIRRQILQEDLLEAVIGIAPKIFYGTGISTSILVLNKNKKTARIGNVLFIDAAREFEVCGSQNRLHNRHIDRVSETFHRFVSEKEFSTVVPITEIEANGWNLGIGRYVGTSSHDTRVDVADAVRKLRDLENSRIVAEIKMYQHLVELGYDS